MKILVSTKDTQGLRKNDFCFVPENELVIPGFECESEDPDGSCGCGRCLCGVFCKKGTTTMKVIETNMNMEEFSKIVATEHIKAWRSDPKEILMIVNELLAVVEKFSVGDVLEYRGGELIRR